MSQRRQDEAGGAGEQLSRPHRGGGLTSTLGRARGAFADTQVSGCLGFGQHFPPEGQARGSLSPGSPQGLLPWPHASSLSPAWKPAWLPLPCTPCPSSPPSVSLVVRTQPRCLLHCPMAQPPLPTGPYSPLTGSTLPSTRGLGADRAPSGLTEALQEHRGKAWSCPIPQHERERA